MPEIDAADYRSPSRRSSVTSTLAGLTDQLRPAVGLLLYLVSLGLIGAAVITFFGVASFSSLYSGSETERRFSRVDRGEINAARPDLSPSADANTAPLEPQPSSRRTDVPALAPPSPPPSPLADAAPMPETNQSQTVGQPPSPSESALQTKPQAPPKDVASTSPFFAEPTDRLFREFAIQQQIKKECGPIKDPDLYRDCVASFHIQSQTR